MTWKTNAWKSPRAKHESGEEWCLQCGTDGKPERAIGVDEDGEPACGLHRVKEIGAGLNAAGDKGLVPFPRTPVPAPVTVVSKQAAERPLNLSQEALAIPLEPIHKPAAAPSPVQTSAKEHDSMNERICAGYNGPCPNQKELGHLNRTGICSVCYARKKYAEKYSAAAKGKTPKTPKVKKLQPPAKFGGPTASDLFEGWSNEEVIEYRDHGLIPERVMKRAASRRVDVEAIFDGPDVVAIGGEALISLSLPVSKIQKLLNLLLAD